MNTAMACQESGSSAHLENEDMENSNTQSFDGFSPMATRILEVSNLHSDVTPTELNKIFKLFGEILDIKIRHPKFINTATPYAFIEFTNINSVVKALESTIYKKHNMVLSFGKRRPSQCLWIYGIDKTTSISNLKFHMDKSNNIRRCVIDRSTECALVYYHQISQARLAILQKHGSTLRDRKIQIDFASAISQHRFHESLKKSLRYKNYRKINEDNCTNNTVCKALINIKKEPQTDLPTQERKRKCYEVRDPSRTHYLENLSSSNPLSYSNTSNNINMDKNYLGYKHKLKKAIQDSNPSCQEVVNDNECRLADMSNILFSPIRTKIIIVKNIINNPVSEFKKMFEFFGKIIKINIKSFGDNLKANNFLFIEFIDIISATNAFNALNGQIVDNNFIELDFGRSEATNCLWIGSVEKSIREKDLFKLFKKFGNITHCEIDRTRKHALILFKKITDAQTAITEVHGCTLNGVYIQIDFASKECEKEFYDHMYRTYHTLDSTIHITSHDHDSTSKLTPNTETDDTFEAVAMQSHSAVDTCVNDDTFEAVAVQSHSVVDTCINGDTFEAVAVQSHSAVDTCINDEDYPVRLIPLHASEIDCINTMLELGTNIINIEPIKSSSEIELMRTHSNTPTYQHYSPESPIPLTSFQFSNGDMEHTSRSNVTDEYLPESHIPSTSIQFSNVDSSIEVEHINCSNFNDEYSPERHIPSTSTSKPLQVSSFADGDIQDDDVDSTQRPKIKKLADLIFEPSFLVNSVLKKPSVFAADAERLKHVVNGVTRQEILSSRQSICDFQQPVHQSCSTFPVTNFKNFSFQTLPNTVALSIHNSLTCESLDVPTSLNHEKILQGTQLTPPDQSLLNEPKMTENNKSSITDNYVPIITKNFNPTHIDINDNLKDRKNVNQKTEIKHIKTVINKTYSTKTSLNSLNTIKNEKPIKQISTDPSCSKIIKAKKCDKPPHQLVEFNMFEVQQVNNNKKDLLINSKNDNTGNKNIKLKKTVVSNSSHNVKEAGKKYDNLKTKEHLNEEYLQKNIRIKSNLENHSNNKRSRQLGKCENVNISETSNSDNTINHKKQKINKEVEKKSIGNEIPPENILNIETNSTVIDCKNSLRSKIKKKDNNQKTTCTKDTSLIPNVLNYEIKELQKTDQNHKNMEKKKKRKKKYVKKINPIVDDEDFLPFVSLYDTVKGRATLRDKQMKIKNKHLEELTENCRQLRQKIKNPNMDLSLTINKGVTYSDRCLRSSSRNSSV